MSINNCLKSFISLTAPPSIGTIKVLLSFLFNAKEYLETEKITLFPSLVIPLPDTLPNCTNTSGVITFCADTATEINSIKNLNNCLYIIDLITY